MEYFINKTNNPFVKKYIEEVFSKVEHLDIQEADHVLDYFSSRNELDESILKIPYKVAVEKAKKWTNILNSK